MARARDEPGPNSEELAYALFCLGFGHGLLGDLARSAELYSESESVCRRAGERRWLAGVRLAQVLFASNSQDAVPLEHAVLEALHLARQIPDHHTCVNALGQLALRPGPGDARQTAFLLGICESYWRDAGGYMLGAEPWATAINQARERCRTALGEAAYQEEHRRGEAATLEEAIAVVLGERPPAPSHFGAAVPTGSVSLTRREEEIARLVAEGLTNRDIAARLVLSARTFETHVQNVLTKTGFTRRAQIAAWFAGLGLPTDTIRREPRGPMGR